MFPKKKRIEDKELTKTYHALRCVACGRQGAVGHHVKTKGSGGDDDPRNLMPLDTIHHNEVHQKGLVAFANKYPLVKRWLESNGWSFDENRQKWQSY